jgi:hypothetical protein
VLQRVRDRLGDDVIRSRFGGRIKRQLDLRLFDGVRGRTGILADAPRRNAEPNRERGQALLSPVVEVVFQSPAFGIGRIHQARTRCAEPLGRVLALGDHSGQAQSRPGRHSDTELHAEDAARERMAGEGTQVVSVAHKVKPTTTAIARVAPRWPNRTAAQISPRKTRYVSGRWLFSPSALGPKIAASSSTPSSARHLSQRCRTGPYHAIASGTRTRAPDKSPSHHVRHRFGAAVVVMTCPSRRETVPMVALTAVPAAIAASVRVSSPRRRAASHAKLDGEAAA